MQDPYGADFMLHLEELFAHGFNRTKDIAMSEVEREELIFDDLNPMTSKNTLFKLPLGIQIKSVSKDADSASDLPRRNSKKTSSSSSWRELLQAEGFPESGQLPKYRKQECFEARLALRRAQTQSNAETHGGRQVRDAVNADEHIPQRLQVEMMTAPPRNKSTHRGKRRRCTKDVDEGHKAKRDAVRGADLLFHELNPDIDKRSSLGLTMSSSHLSFYSRNAEEYDTSRE